MVVKSFWTNCSSSILGAVFPPKCSLCQVLSQENPCTECLAELVVPSRRIEEFHDGVLDYVRWRYEYDGRAAQAVRRLKYERATALASWMAVEVAIVFEESDDHCDMIAPVPIHWRRRVARGFNQALYLCEALPEELMADSSLMRVRATKPQVGLSQQQRLTNLKGAFKAKPSEVEGRHILLVDDVMTTGQTLRVCAQELKSRGAKTVGALVFARSDQPMATRSPMIESSGY